MSQDANPSEGDNTRIVPVETADKTLVVKVEEYTDIFFPIVSITHTEKAEVKTEEPKPEEPTEVKEGLYIGTATYVYKLEPQSNFKLKFVNMSATSKKVWLGVRLLREKTTDELLNPEILDVFALSEPESPLGVGAEAEQELNSVTTDYTI